MSDDPALRLVLDGLESVLRCFGAAREHVTVVGGLAPSLLVPTPAGRAHVGTADVDLCLTVALADGAIVPHASVYVAGPAAIAALKAAALDALARVRDDPAALHELRDAVERLDDLFTEGRVGPVWYATFMQPADDFARDRHERFALETVAAFTLTIREGLG